MKNANSFCPSADSRPSDPVPDQPGACSRFAGETALERAERFARTLRRFTEVALTVAEGLERKALAASPVPTEYLPAQDGTAEPAPAAEASAPEASAAEPASPETGEGSAPETAAEAHVAAPDLAETAPPAPTGGCDPP